MSNAIKVIFVFILGFSSANFVNAQKDLKKADKLFESRLYEQAIPGLKKAVQADPKNANLGMKLATCFNNIGDNIGAIRAYEAILKSNGILPVEAQLSYGHALKSVGLYDKAQKIYWDHKKYNPTVSEHFALGCDFAKNMLEENEKYEISLFKYNSKRSDFGATFYKNKIVFASFKNSNSTGNPVMSQICIENDTYDGVDVMKSIANPNKGVGPLSYSRDSKMVAYTKQSFMDGTVQVDPQADNMEVFYALTNQDGSFKDEIDFPYNDKEYSTAFPQLSFNGNAMYFASTMPGGFGGYDLYVSYFKNGDWSKPENLGETVNTAGNEITPFFDGLYLYYSSDYSHGLGAFDVFSSKVVDGKWSFGENLGNGVNSPADDYYFMINPDSGEMFFTSNRLGGRGNDDIYVAREFEVIEYAIVDDSNEDNVYIPKSVSLEDLTPISRTRPEMSTDIVKVNLPAKQTRNERAVPVNDKVNIKLIDNLPGDKVKPAVENEEMSLFGARKIALGEIFSAKSGVYFIQLAALSQSRGNVDKFRNLVQFGSLYKVYHTTFTKIKLGYYLDRQEASEVLNSIKRLGYNDAFITYETLDGAEMELVASSYEVNDYKANSFDYVNQSKYKVRLGSYSDPLWFDTSNVKDIGKIEQWSKGKWTIFILSGFGDLESAQSAMIKAQNRGYRDAEIVIDNNGILERLKQN